MKIKKLLTLIFTVVLVLVTFFSHAMDDLLRIIPPITKYQSVPEKLGLVLKKYVSAFQNADCPVLGNLLHTLDAKQLNNDIICQYARSKYFHYMRKKLVEMTMSPILCTDLHDTFVITYNIESSFNNQTTIEKPLVFEKVTGKNSILKIDKKKSRKIYINKKTNKIELDLTYIAYDNIVDKINEIKKLLSDLENLYYKTNIGKKEERARWEEIKNLIFSAQNEIFSSELDVIGMPVFQAIKLDNIIEHLKKTASRHEVKLDDVKTCLELANM